MTLPNSKQRETISWVSSWLWPVAVFAVTLWVSKEIHAKRLEDLEQTVISLRTDAATEANVRVTNEKELRASLDRWFEYTNSRLTTMSSAIGRIEGRLDPRSLTFSPSPK